MNLRAFLAGSSWRFSRRVRSFRSDGAPPSTSVIEGTAAWVEDVDDAGVLHFAERGTMAAGAGPPIETRAAYVWRLGASAASARVHFPDGRVFCDVNLERGSCEGLRHECGADVYVGSFHASSASDAADQPALVVTWRVRGPAKDYESVTEFTRLGVSAPPSSGEHAVLG